MLQRLLLPVLMAGLILSVTASAEDKVPPRDKADEFASIARGGRLYDDWGKELGTSAMRVAEHSVDRMKGRPERCVDCHGWDYRGKDGHPGGRGALPPVKGINEATNLPPERIKAILNDVNHGYGDFLGADDFDDLVTFVTKGQVTMDAMIDPATLRARGEASRGNTYFQTICANCHGNDGQLIPETEPLGDTARANPWRAIHTLLNGHPNGNMPALRVLDREIVVNMLAYVQTLPLRDIAASIVRGGRLYDTWYKENKRDVPPGVHPAFPAALAKNIEPRATWRCKECHGWDYRGLMSADGKETVIKGISAMANGSIEAVMVQLRNPTHHRFEKLLSVRDLLDVATFVTKGQVNMDDFIDRKTRKARGDAKAYAAHYQTICATCHGAAGRDIRTMPPLGRVATVDPYRALHGIFNGHPGEAMPALLAFPRELSIGLLAYIQSLPAQR